MAFNKRRWQASNFDEKIGENDSYRRLGDSGLRNYKIGLNNRSASGNQEITGVGFAPSIVILLAFDTTAGNLNWSVGFDYVTSKGSLYQDTNGTLMHISTTKSINILRNAGNYIIGEISLLGSDGFTISWVLNGVCTTNFLYICLP